ncbi:MAG: glycosyltransferase [Oscillospiraceae bacterium]
MKILQVNNVYGVGSTGKLTRAIHRGLQADGIASVVLYGRGPTSREANTHRICSNFYGKRNALRSRITGLMYGGCQLSTNRAISRIEKEKPDVVHLQCINGYFLNIYQLIEWLKNQKIPTVLTLHAEFLYTANCGHAFLCDGWRTGCGHCPRLKEATKSWMLDRTHQSYSKMLHAFSGFDRGLKVISVSPWLEKRAQMSPILSGKNHGVILNGVDTRVFCCRDSAALSERHHVHHRNVIFHVTALFRDLPGDGKGGWYLLRLAERMPSTLFLVAGPCQLQGSVPDNVLMLGEIHDQELLAQYYSLADLTVITSRRETYSMVCAESLCCGTPVVGFRAGAPEMISLQEYSQFVPQGDLDALEHCVCQWLNRTPSLSKQEIEAEAHRVYDEKVMIAQYEKVYEELLCGWNGSN